jgi:hypothetical protein
MHLREADVQKTRLLGAFAREAVRILQRSRILNAGKLAVWHAPFVFRGLWAVGLGAIKHGRAPWESPPAPDIG